MLKEEFRRRVGMIILKGCHIEDYARKETFSHKHLCKLEDDLEELINALWDSMVLKEQIDDNKQ